MWAGNKKSTEIGCIQGGNMATCCGSAATVAESAGTSEFEAEAVPQPGAGRGTMTAIVAAGKAA
jgi:hypothetical protein